MQLTITLSGSLEASGTVEKMLESIKATLAGLNVAFSAGPAALPSHPPAAVTGLNVAFGAEQAALPSHPLAAVTEIAPAPRRRGAPTKAEREAKASAAAMEAQAAPAPVPVAPAPTEPSVLDFFSPRPASVAAPTPTAADVKQAVSSLFLLKEGSQRALSVLSALGVTPAGIGRGEYVDKYGAILSAINAELAKG